MRSQVRDSVRGRTVGVPDPSPRRPSIAGLTAGLTAVERLRLCVISAVIALLVFSQSSGLVAADTKLDLVVSPARFLGRALQAWEPIGGSGQLQDQAYGYLFPMGPFFLIGKLSALSPWVVQRFWETLLLVVAFLSARRLASLLGVRGFWPSVASGLVYALAPRTLTELFAISSELLPVAVLPLVLIPLVHAANGGAVRSGAMRSGAALLLAGGINASATLAILPVPALWLATRSRGPRRAALLRWWAVAVVLSCLWWFVPLLVLGRYSPPFLDWIESSAVTMSQNSFVAVARGADHWQAYLGSNVWPAGWIYAVAPAAIVATAAVAALGFAGLASRRVPHRLFLVSTLVVGFLILTAGHSASIGSPASDSVQALLDGVLSPFRNIHKFDPMVRLPLAIGVGHAVQPVARFVADGVRRGLRGAPTWAGPYVAGALAFGLAAVAVAPALADRLVPLPRGPAMVGYWKQAAGWLDRHAGQGRALVLPGAGRPEMYWGATVDEPMQAVASAPWAARETVPLAQAGYVRLLDAVELLVATGTPQPELAPLLLRSGIGYLVLRADLTPTADATPVGVVRSTLRNSPGLSVVRSFGPKIQKTGATNRLVDEGATDDLPAVQILRVGDGADRVELASVAGAVLANGSADTLPALLRAGVAGDRPVLFGADAEGVRVPDAERVLTDGLRKREVSFGHPGPVAATMTGRQPYQAARKVHDYLPSDPGPLSTMEYGGIADVRASSSGADAAAFLNRGPEHAPWYAVDGDPATAWLSGSADGAVGQWLELRFIAPVTNPTVTIRFPSLRDDTPTSLVVQTDSGSKTVDVTPDSEPQTLAVPTGETQRLRLTIASVLSGRKGTAAGFAEVSVAGLTATRALRVPGARAADLISFRAADGYRSGCVAVRTSSACIARLYREGEEQDGISRVFTLRGGASYTPSASVVLTPSAALDTVLDAGAPIQVDASSTESLDPRQRPGAAVDASVGTTWAAAAGDTTPTLTLSWRRPVSIAGFTMRTSTDAPVSVPSRVRVQIGDQRWAVRVGAGGEVRLPEPATARTLRIEIVRSAVRVSTDSVTRRAKILPTGVSDILIPGVPGTPSAGDVHLPCGQGPTIDVDGTAVRTRVTASRAALLSGAEVEATACAGPVPLSDGEHRITVEPTTPAVPMGVTLAGPAPASPAVVRGTSHVEKWSATERVIRVRAASESLLVVHENFNAGWHASLDGHRLPAVRVDGWQQAFVVPAGAAGAVHVTYGPARVFDAGLLAGALAAAVLLLLAVRRSGDADRAGGVAGVLPAWGLWLGAGIVLTLTAGFAGLVAAGLAAWLGRSRWSNSRWLPAVAGGAMLAAGVVNAVGPSVSSHSLTDSPLSQALVLVALSIPLVRLLDRPARGAVGGSPPTRSADAPAATTTPS